MPPLTTAQPRNSLLKRLQPQQFARLEPHFKLVSLASGQVLYESHARIDYSYFPLNVVLSVVTVMDNGNAIEVGTIGNEGATGFSGLLCGPSISPHRMLVQIGGEALRIDAETLEREAKEYRHLYDLLLRHHCAFLAQISQSVACNGLHPLVKRCCRWLLMTHDRAEGDELPLTHEFLSFMLGVRRPGVSEALQALQDQGLIDNPRGVITVTNRAGLEAASCECYRTVALEYQRLFSSE